MIEKRMNEATKNLLGLLVLVIIVIIAIRACS